MPQLIVADFLPQLIWLAITFGALYFIISRLAIPKIGSVIEQRHGRIAADVAEASRLKEDTEKAIETYEAALAEARASAHVIVSENRAQMTAEINKEAAALDERLAKKLAEAEVSIAKTRDAAMAQVTGIAQDTTEAIVTELLGKKPAKAAISSAVSSAAKG
ncbi:MAG: F0F1 ATP synthase subunit B' [Pseudomonadota bacterium]